ncbi:MAG: hypothetical protein AAGD11_05580 [Planctomycetota bacterium]
MDFLNQATGQLRELMMSMTPAARVTAVLLLGVIVVSLGYLVQHQSASPDSYLFNGEFQPGSVVERAYAAIAQAGLEGAVREGNRIKVPSGRKSEFLAAVADAGALPPNFHKIVEDALNVSPFASSDVRRAKYKAGREQQLSMMVGDMDGIEQANVMYDIHEGRGFGEKRQATATVSVRPSAGGSLDVRQIKMIQKAVAGGVAELKPDDVVVSNSGDGSTYGANDGASAYAFEPGYHQTRIAFEQSMQAKIEHLLRTVPGVRVQVVAELDPTLQKTTQSLTPEADPAALRTMQKDETDKVSEVENAGRPGLDAQGPGRRNAEEEVVTVKNERSVVTTEADNFVGSKKEETIAAGLVPEDIRVTVAVPVSYPISIWRERERMKGNDPNQPFPDEFQTTVLERLKGEISDSFTNAIVQLIPGELAENKLDDVQVVFLESLTPEPVEGPSTATQALGWASRNFNTMTMAVVALVSLMMLRSMVKSIPAAEPAAAISSPTLALDTTDSATAPTEGESAESEENQRPRLRLKKGDSLKDDLVEIVREDPDAAAAILRSWIGNAG